MDISIRQATEDDFPSILALINELAVFEKAPEQVTNSIELMRKEKDFFHCFVAETSEKEVVGMALYYFVYYTWVGKSLYLDDIFVKENFRKHKIGTSLLRKVFEIARKEDCKRVRWQVLNWNQSAIEMYKKCGAVIDKEWWNCTFDSVGIKNFMM